MSLSANRTNIGFEDNFVFRTTEMVDGALAIYLGALVNYEAANIGYAKVASDTSNEEFAGIAAEQLTVAAADNTADGTYELKIYAKGSGKVFKLPYTGTVTRANIGDTVYVYDDQYVGLTGSVSNNVEVGTIVDIEGDYVHVAI